MAEINNDEKRIGVSGEQIEEAVGKVPTIEADVKSNKQNISALQTASAQHTADIEKNTADIELKANADEVYSTLKEMSDWLTEHSGSAAEMNTAIQANTKAIADNATAIEANTADIEQNKSDILKIQRNSGQDITVANRKWYRIAENTIGVGRSAILHLKRRYSNNPTEIITLAINVAFDNSTKPFFKCNIVNKYVQASLFTKIRIVMPTSYSQNSKMYIDVFYNSTTANGIGATIFGEIVTHDFEPITLLKPTSAPEIPEDHTSVEFDLTGGDIFDRLEALETALAQTTIE